ncbi:hypothetical protein DFJ43DRAFT_1153260 [Lentinula guzmanii]|uniref:Uncharacterized protein n=1 Tax=Lentinula guzmanii TaxID=2804957 RepID=A0AA38JKN8_9AGAR|nr:hypothetical protein DFJ43DRAFT_1153260 [Lentinula guzmanii]
MVYNDVPHIHVDVSASPLVNCFQQTSGNSEYHLFSNLTTSGSTNDDNNDIPSFSRFYSHRQASSSSLTSDPRSSSSTTSSSSLTQPILSSSESDLTSASRIPATAILALLDLLDVFDADVETQVAHVKENIKDTFGLVEICRAERVEKLARASHKSAFIRLLLNTACTDDKGIAPSLIAAKEKLQRSQLEDKLGQALQQRPKPEELVKEGILLEEVPQSSV